MRSDHLQRIFDKLAAAEDHFLEREFLAPVVAGGEVRVRIGGVVCTLRVTPPQFEGWGIFRPKSHASADLVGEAGLTERRRYLELFPSVALVACLGNRDHWMAMAAHRGDMRFHIDGLVPVRLAGEIQQFDRVRTRFDGGNFWFDSRDRAQDPATAAFLRKSLEGLVEPNQLVRPGLTPEERDAYAFNYHLRTEARRQTEAQQAAARLREALGHGGAELVDFLERNDGYRITYSIDGRQHVSAVDKSGLTVQVAGICLSGQDREFDLASLVGVIREAEETGEIVPVGEE